MSFDRKLNINKNIISIILTSFFSFIIFFSNESIYVKKVERLIIDIYSTLSYPTTWYGNILSIKEENSVLSQKIVQISLMNAKLENYKIENDNLRNMLKFKESYKYLSLLPANIVNNHYSISSKSCIINAGSNEKINNNLAVIDMYGNLMGKIISTAENNSKVQLLTDNNFSVSIKLNDNSLAQFKPTHGRYGILEVAGEEGPLVKIVGLVEKPLPSDASSRFAVIGRYILHPEVFSHLDKKVVGADKEIQLTDAIAMMIGGAPFYGMRFEGKRFDCGDRVEYLEANLAVALTREEMSDEVLSIIKRYIKMPKCKI